MVVVVAVAVAAVVFAAVVVSAVITISTATTVVSAITSPLISLQKQRTTHEMYFLPSGGARV